MVFTSREDINPLGDGEDFPLWHSGIILHYWKPSETLKQSSIYSLGLFAARLPSIIYYIIYLSLYLLLLICWETNAFTKKFIVFLSPQQINVMPSTVVFILWCNIVVRNKKYIFSLFIFNPEILKSLGFPKW